MFTSEVYMRCTIMIIVDVLVITIGWSCLLIWDSTHRSYGFVGTLFSNIMYDQLHRSVFWNVYAFESNKSAVWSCSIWINKEQRQKHENRFVWFEKENEYFTVKEQKKKFEKKWNKIDKKSYDVYLRKKRKCSLSLWELKTVLDKIIKGGGRFWLFLFIQRFFSEYWSFFCLFYH